jgi:UPF0716 protein FxsA
VILFLVMALVVAPLVELGVFVEVGRWIGYWPALGILIGVSVLGVWIVKRQGTGVLRRMRAQLAAGQVPTLELIDGVLLLAAGVLLILPGFVSDLVGLVLLVPVARRVPGGWIRRRAVVRVATGVGTVGGAIAVRSRERRGAADRSGSAAPARLEPPADPPIEG